MLLIGFSRPPPGQAFGHEKTTTRYCYATRIVKLLANNCNVREILYNKELQENTLKKLRQRTKGLLFELYMGRE